MKGVHVYVSGKVQGIGFRATVQKHALGHNLRGFARNLKDGRVEIYIQGDAESVEAFLREIQENPGGAVITQFKAQEEKLREIPHSFEIQ